MQVVVGQCAVDLLVLQEGESTLMHWVWRLGNSQESLLCWAWWSSLNYIVSSRLTWATQWDCISKHSEHDSSIGRVLSSIYKALVQSSELARQCIPIAPSTQGQKFKAILDYVLNLKLAYFYSMQHWHAQCRKSSMIEVETAQGLGMAEKKPYVGHCDSFLQHAR